MEGNKMPVLTVKGMPRDVEQGLLKELVNQLRMTVCVPLRLEPFDVSVFIPADLLCEGLGEELVCFVEGIFEWSERTTAVRDNTARAALEILRLFAWRFLPQCEKVEVICTRFNQNVDGFAVCDPRKEK
jgi:hypothetical protein